MYSIQGNIENFCNISKDIYIEKNNEYKFTKELVIGCYNYENPELSTKKGGIKFFIDSLRKYNKNCTIIILMNICPNEIKNFFKKNNVLFLLGFKEKLMFKRFILYFKIISKYEIFEKILMTDMNDVIFQGNPVDISPRAQAASEITILLLISPL